MRRTSPSRTIAEVRPHRGAPTLFVNGAPVPSMAYMTYALDRRFLRQFAEAGVHLYSFSATPTAAAYGLAEPCWTAPDAFDDAPFEERLRMVLESDPQAWVLPRLNLFSPRWWDERHGDDLVTFDPSSGGPQPFLHSGDKRVPSWASEAWREDTAKALVRMIRHIESSAYADRVIGYHLASGTTEEWMMWGANEDEWADYSPANVAGFRCWLRKTYRNDAKLQAAWGDASATVADAAIPSKLQRQAAGMGVFRDPTADQPAIDYDRYNSELAAETICYMARAAKEATRREKLVGAFYGYVLELAGEPRQQNAGHLALRRVWDSPDIDFLSSPTSYTCRQPGSGYSHFMSPVDGLKLAGKLWFDENDIRTWRTPCDVPAWTGKTDSYEATLGQMRRELANVLCNACGQWWFDMDGGWYDDPRMMREIARMRDIADRSIAWDRSSVDEIAVIVDDVSLCYMQVGNTLGGSLILEQLPQLGRIGAPVGYYALDDLDRLTARRMLVFLNCFAPTRADRAAIEKLKGDGRTLVWIYAPGVFRDGRLAPAAMEELTGIRLRLERCGGLAKVEYAGGEAALRGTVYGTETPVAPMVVADDPRVEVVGRLVDSARPGLAMRRFDGWTSVFSAAPAMPAPLLRSLARMAGVHFYINPAPDSRDVVYANRSLLALCVDDPGPRRITLPEPRSVRELYADVKVGRGVGEFVADMGRHETRLWHLVQ